MIFKLGLENDSPQQLSDSELDIMLILWDASTPVMRSYIDEQLQGKHNWKPGTVVKLLSRLQEKGYINKNTSGKGKRILYSPTCSKQQYLELQKNTAFHRLYKRTIKDFISMLCDDSELTESEIDDLYQYLKAAKEKKKGHGPESSGQ